MATNSTLNQKESQLTPEIGQSSNSSQPTPKEPKTNRLKYLFAVIIFILLLAGGWFAYHKNHQTLQSKSKKSTAYNGPVDNITIGNVGEYSIFHLIAHDQGLFANNGLNATIKEYASGPPAVADLLAKKVDFAIGADFVGVNNIFTNKNLRILSQVSQQDSFRIIGLKSKGINQPEDIKGKRVAVTLKGAGEFFLQRFLSLNGLKPTDITEVNLVPADMITQISNQQVDAVVIFDPHAYNLQKSLGDKAVSWSAQGNLKTSTLIYATDEYLQAHKTVADRYMQAMIEAQAYLKQNDKASRLLLAKDLKYDQAYVDYIWPKFDFAMTLNQELLLGLEDEARFVISNSSNPQNKVPNYLDYIYFNSLEKTNPNAVDIVH